MKPKKVVVTINSKEEFAAILHRHADEDAEKYQEGLQIFLTPDEVAFLERFRKGEAAHG